MPGSSMKTKAAMTASTTTGPAVHASSSLVAPCTCAASSNRGRFCLRYLQMKAIRRPSTRTKIAAVKIDTKSQLSRIPSAFGESGATGANWARRERMATGCHSMNVPAASSPRTRVRLPADVVRPFEVYLNGVEQEEGSDFRVDGRTLVFDRTLRTE